MTSIKDEHEVRLARLEHMIEELRVQTTECIRLTAEARLDARTGKKTSQRERAARTREGSKPRPASARRKSK